MSQPFSRTTRSLRASGGRLTPLLLGSSLLLLLVWGLWFVLSPLPLYETSTRAALEVEGKPHSLASTATGRVASHTLLLGRPVRLGEVLVELERESESWTEKEEEARLAGLRGEIKALEAQLQAERRAEAAQAGRDHSARAEAGAQARADSLKLAQASEEETRAEQLFQNRVIARVDRERAHTEARLRRAAWEQSRLATSRLRHAQALERSERETRRAEREQMLARLTSELQAAEARLGGSRQQGAERQIRAPVSGRLASVRDLAPGSVIAPGEVLATLLPDREIGATAHFPEAAQGWIRPGQPVRLHLDGYPWTQYGWIEAEVAEVAEESEQGQFQASLRILRHDPRLGLRHGLPGRAEVEVGRTTPLGLLLRVLGRSSPEGQQRP